jgi:hypothetical protein
LSSDPWNKQTLFQDLTNFRESSTRRPEIHIFLPVVSFAGHLKAGNNQRTGAVSSFMLSDLFYNNEALDDDEGVTYLGSSGNGNTPLVKPPPGRSQSGFVGLENQ